MATEEPKNENQVQEAPKAEKPKADKKKEKPVPSRYVPQPFHLRNKPETKL